MTEQPPLPLPPPAAPAARPVARSRPWWAKLIGRFLAPWIEIKREPTVPPFTLDRPVCYVLEDYGFSNTLILDRACREAGLPSPLAPLPGDGAPGMTFHNEGMQAERVNQARYNRCLRAPRAHASGSPPCPNASPSPSSTPCPSAS